MDETELKFQVPPARSKAVEAAVAGTGRAPAPRMRLQAAYFDTADRALAGARLALRLRREGRQWVQTLKGATDDGMTRLEHNVPRGGAAAMPSIEPALHAGTPAGDKLLALLGANPALQTLYRTDIRRRTRALLLRPRGLPAARVELAFDSGRIAAGDASIAVCELEIELLAGSKRAVIDTARTWVPRFGLWLDLRSKAERGDLLARGERVAPASLAGKLQLDAAMTPHAAWQAVLRHCAEQILANASQIASGEHAPEHVHQLRVGLRRLRSALALFEIDDAALAEGAATLFRNLGAARDSAVIDAEFGTTLIAAMRGAGLSADALPATLPPIASTPPIPPATLLRQAASQTWLLDLLAAMQLEPGTAAADAPPLRDALAARLNRWHRQVVAEAKRYAELDDEARHRLRKRAKRLRYAAEFCAALFARRNVRRYLRALRALQERLGAVSDVLMAIAAFAPRAPADPHAMFALGWLVARREALVAGALPELAAFADADRFWKERGHKHTPKHTSKHTPKHKHQRG